MNKLVLRKLGNIFYTYSTDLNPSCMKFFLIGLFLALTSQPLFAQKREPVEFGDIPMADLKMMKYSKDTWRQ